MIDPDTKDSPVPFSMQPGRIEDFVKGMTEAQDQKTRLVLRSTLSGALAGLGAWQVYRYARGVR